MTQHQFFHSLTPRPGKQYIIAFQHIDQFLAGMQHYIGDPGNTQGQSRQHQVMQTFQPCHLAFNFTYGNRKAQREPLQLYRKNHQYQQPDPEYRGGSQNQAEGFDNPVWPAILIDTGHDSKDHA